MATTFPTTLQDLDATRGTGAQPLSTPNHATHHTTEDDTLEALQAKVGVDSSAVTTSHDYKLSGVTGSDKAVSKTGTETLTNKTLTSPQVNFGSDATGDMVYRTAGGVTARLPVGSASQIIQVSGAGIPEWIANPAVSDASTTVKGTIEIATDAEVNAGTATGATGAVLVIPASSAGAVAANKVVQFTAATKYPAADGSLITNLTNPTIFKTGLDSSRAMDAASSTQNIAHGLGKVPKFVSVDMVISGTGYSAWSTGKYDGTSQNSVLGYATSSTSGGTSGTIDIYQSSGVGQSAVVSWDATNIIFTWTKAGAPAANNLIITWLAEA